jgi:hypothetical protein
VIAASARDFYFVSAIGFSLAAFAYFMAARDGDKGAFTMGCSFVCIANMYVILGTVRG